MLVSEPQANLTSWHWELCWQPQYLPAHRCPSISHSRVQETATVDSSAVVCTLCRHRAGTCPDLWPLSGGGGDAGRMLMGAGEEHHGTQRGLCYTFPFDAEAFKRHVSTHYLEKKNTSEWRCVCLVISSLLWSIWAEIDCQALNSICALSHTH